MQNITQVSCGLNLGLIFSLDYSYSPENGVNIKIYFFKQDGNYPTLNLLPLQKTSVQIGTATFSVYPVASEVQLSDGRRVMWVEFVDEFYQLKKYHVVLPNRGCGFNVFTLGAPVDKRTLQQKQAAALDPTTVQIQNLTQYPDYEYSFNDFLTLLRTKFNVNVGATFNGTVTQPFEGTFESVLRDWCDYYNLSFFFENSIIKIFDPTKLTINLPTQPSLALSYNVSQDIRSTYGKTVSNWFQQDGGEYPLNQTSNGNGTLLTRTSTLFPIGYEFGLSQISVDLNQVAAAMYGQEYWFLYNYYRGTTASQCGWTPLNSSNVISGFSITQSLYNLAKPAAPVVIDQNTFDQNFAAYQQYGQSIAGRWYLSEQVDGGGINTDQNYTWFNETQGQIFNFTGADDKVINLSYLIPGNFDTNIIDGTAVNQFYSGVNYIGNRIAFRDDKALSQTFMLGSGVMATATPDLVAQTYKAIFDVPGSEAMDFSQIATVPDLAKGVITAYTPLLIPQNISITFANLAGLNSVFLPRFSSIPIRGITKSDYSTIKSAQNEPAGVNIVNSNVGPTVVGNTSVIKTRQNGSYNVYYNKFNQCASASTPDQYFSFDFEPHQISTDNQIGVTFSKLSNNSYRLDRDYGFINSLVNNPLLPTLAQARTFPTRRVSFTLNYFYPVPTSFLTNGLVGMSIEIGGAGISASYSYSNEVLRLPDRLTPYNQLAQQMKNSWTRTYRPQEVIT